MMIRAQFPLKVAKSPGEKVVEDKLITFDDPPIQEVALGRTFLPREDFVIPYFGAFWATIRDQFPKAQHAAPILDPSDFMSNDQMPLPRVWFVADDDATLVQLQQNRFHFNWRRVSAEDRRSYPRFPAVQRQFLNAWELFEKFVQAETGIPLQPVFGELSYTNHIFLADPKATAFDIAEQTLSNSVWQRPVGILKCPRGYASNYQFTLPTGDTLQIGIAAAKRAGSSSELLKLELTVRGKCSNDKAFDSWSAEAHNVIVQSFKELTNPEIHKHWKLREA
jgi:uncharacterized protein (TIGR04255 family)